MFWLIWVDWQNKLLSVWDIFGMHWYCPSLVHYLELISYFFYYRPIENERENVYSKFLLMKSSKKYFIFSSACYLIIWLMTSLKNFGKIGILNIWQLAFLWKVHCCAKFLFFELETSNFGYLLIFDRDFTSWS